MSTPSTILSKTNTLTHTLILQITDFIFAAKERLRSVCVHDLMILHNNKAITEQLVAIERDLNNGMKGGVTTGAGRGGRIGAGSGSGLGSDVLGPILGGAEGHNGTIPGVIKGPQSMGQKLCLKIVGEKVTKVFSTSYLLQ